MKLLSKMLARRLILFVAAPFLLADGPPQSVRAWLFKQPMRSEQKLELNLVRATVRVTRRPGPMRIEIRPSQGSTLEGVSFRIDQDARGIKISDVYPPAPPAGFATECEPPSGERGAFWRSNVEMDVLISLPPGVQSEVHVMDGPTPRGN